MIIGIDDMNSFGIWDGRRKTDDRSTWKNSNFYHAFYIYHYIIGKKAYIQILFY